MMKKNRYKSLMGVVLLLATVLLSSCSNLVVLDSKGPVGNEEVFLIKVAFILMLIVVLPVFVMVIWFSVRYRASNEKATYKPNWAHSHKIELVVWLVPIAIVVALSYLTWVKTHSLDPYKPLKSDTKPVRIEVVSTDWNWLFIYPDYNIAVVNHMVFPAKTPLNFKLTSASVMTSFFIPQLGSQIYAMAGMQTKLHLQADHEGTYLGQNIEYSGTGYATMHFDAVATSPEEFKEWVAKAKQSPDVLDMKTYEKFSQPNTNYPVTIYSSVAPKLFNHILMQYMGWMGGTDHKMNMTDSTDNSSLMHGMQDSTQMQKAHGSMIMQSDSGHVTTKTMEEN
jgi:cytochrome o ubiquinol oxidase subunit II